MNSAFLIALALAVPLLFVVPGDVRAQHAPEQGASAARAAADPDQGTVSSVPTHVATEVQIEAPPENGASPVLLDRAEFPTLFAIAIDQPLGDPDGGRAATLRLTPLSFAALLGAKPIGGSAVNGRFGALRRVGLSATLGGPTQADDATRAARPRSLTNHFTAELKLSLMESAERRGSDAASPTGGRVRAVSLGLIADTYATGFGRDLYVVKLIAESRRPPGLFANLGYRREERIHDRRRAELAVGAGFGWPCFAAFRRPVFATLSCEELIRNLARVSVFQGNARLDVRLSSRLRFTTGVTWTSHAQRYVEGGVRGSAGLGFVLR